MVGVDDSRRSGRRRHRRAGQAVMAHFGARHSRGVYVEGGTIMPRGSRTPRCSAISPASDRCGAEHNAQNAACARRGLALRSVAGDKSRQD